MITLPKSQLRTIIREEYLRMRLNEEKAITKWEETGLLARVDEASKLSVVQKLEEGMGKVLQAFKAGKITQEQAAELTDKVIISLRGELNPSTALPHKI